MGRRLVLLVLAVGAAVGVYLAFRGSPESPDEDHKPAAEHKVQSPTPPPVAVTEKDLIGRELTAVLALAPGQGFPTGFPWYPLHDIGDRGGFPLVNFLHAQPLAFLENCLERYEREVQGYTCTFIKKERVGGKLYPSEKDQYEVIQVAFREHPFSVYFKWQAKPKLASRCLYVEGENDNKLLARPFVTLLPVMTREVDSQESKSSSRYTIAQFGIGKGTQRTVESMRRAQARGALHLRYEGLVTLAEVGDRVCYKFVRTPYDPLEEDNLNELTVYIDQETWLQVGSVLRDIDGNLIAEYYFRDIELNPEIPDKQFTRGAL
jgi:hypothetical protein